MEAYQVESEHEHDEGAPPRATPSKWEWVPIIALAALAVVYFSFAKPGGAVSRFAFFVGLGLVPGALWRLAGRSSWNVHRVFFAASLIAFVLNNPELRPNRDTWAKIVENWPIVTLGFLISFTQPLWGMLRTQRLLTDSGVKISKYDSLKLCLSGSFFNIFLPGSTGGDAYRVYAITHGYRTKLGPAIASITLDRLLGLPSLILVVLLGMLLDYDFFRGNRILAGLIPFISVAGGVCLVLVIYLAFAGKARRREDWGRPYESADTPLGWLRRTHVMIATNVKRPATLPLALWYGFMSHIACIAACLFFGVALGVKGVPALRYFLIVPMAMTINSIPGAPGGVGQGELAMATLLDMAAPGQGNAQEGVMVMLLFRLSNMVLGVIGGAFYAMGKMDFSGIDHISQGLTRIMSRDKKDRVNNVFSGRFSREVQEGYEKAKQESNRFYADPAGAPRPASPEEDMANRTLSVSRMVFDFDDPPSPGKDRGGKEAKES